jgi:signal transduction histidine kinase
MQKSFQKQPHINILPDFSVNEKLRLREADIEEVVKTLQVLLPQHVYGDNDVTITLVEKNLKIISDLDIMKKALTHLVENLMHAMPSYGKFSLTVNQVNFEIESLLNSDDSIIGACAFIPLEAAYSFGEKIKEKLLKPFFITNKYGNDLCLTIAYRIIKQHHESTKVKSRVEQSTEVNLYLPLTKLEIVNMMSIPAG